jgi:transcription elongation factor Elf1
MHFISYDREGFAVMLRRLAMKLLTKTTECPKCHEKGPRMSFEIKADVPGMACSNCQTHFILELKLIECPGTYAMEFRNKAIKGVK